MKLLGTTLAVAICISTSAASAAGSNEPDWPCVQRKIPALSAGMMWAGPPIDEAANKLWQNDTKLSTLALRLAARRTSTQEAQKLIETFAGSLQPSDKQQKLTALFAGTLSLINKERQQIMAGITKYTRKQKTLAETINKTRTEFAAALKVKSKTDEDKKARRDLEQKLIWQSRIHEDREKSLLFVCESPVILEQRAFELAREIANHLE